MKNAFSILALLILFYIAQTSFFTAIFLVLDQIMGTQFWNGHTLNLVLMLLMYLSLHRDRSGMLIWAILFGMVGNWFGVVWNGAYAAGLFAAAILCSALRKHALLKDGMSIALFSGSIFLVEGLTHLGMGHLLQQIQSPLKYQLGTLLLYVLINAICAPPVFFFLRLFDIWTGATPPRSRQSLMFEI